ncbi:uncharacterized protein LOC111061935 [Nilaparvata lugens]|uniref:uncharacterized protein LOC111061935 n=1 Tax=Nilaparvata lugens TaxID=108931 RepID=UPI00193DDA8D|nr:uncharacterized protein LOC111061935 [Nilaparvata lugens]
MSEIDSDDSDDRPNLFGEGDISDTDPTYVPDTQGFMDSDSSANEDVQDNLQHKKTKHPEQQNDVTSNADSSNAPDPQDSTDSHPSANEDVQDDPQPKRAKHPVRKKTCRYELWKRNIAHKNRNEGKAYTDRKGTHHREKQVREFIHQCRFECNVNFCEEKRQELFKQYWELGNWELQTAFLSSCITMEEPR